jgi:hypothetical protein
MDDRWDDRWEEQRTPWLRRPRVRGTVAVFAALSFLIITLMSTCAPRRTVVRTTTTTTVPGLTAIGELPTEAVRTIE